MTNFEYLQSMSQTELSDWMNKYLVADDAPYMLWFDRKYCSNCESIMCHYEDSAHEFPCAYCELNDNKCRFFPEIEDMPDSKEIIKMWLNSEVEE